MDNVHMYCLLTRRYYGKFEYIRIFEWESGWMRHIRMFKTAHLLTTLPSTQTSPQFLRLFLTMYSVYPFPSLVTFWSWIMHTHYPQWNANLTIKHFQLHLRRYLITNTILCNTLEICVISLLPYRFDAQQGAPRKLCYEVPMENRANNGVSWPSQYYSVILGFD